VDNTNTGFRKAGVNTKDFHRLQNRSPFMG